MRNGHRITVTFDSRCGKCRLPVAVTVFRTRCECEPDPEAYWPCRHTVAFYRHFPDGAPRGR